MRPIRTEETNSVFKLPGGDESSDLPVERAVSEHDIPIIVSTWEPTPEERDAVAGGANVELVIWGTGQPPVFVGVTHLQEVADAVAE